MGQRPPFVAGETNQTMSVRPEFFKVRSGNFLLAGAEFGGRNEATKILISGADYALN